MNMSDLIKATLFCGGVAFLVYSFPALSQTLIIGFLSMVWLSCAIQTLSGFWRRKTSRC
jgi:hypothetical protein